MLIKTLALEGPLRGLWASGLGKRLPSLRRAVQTPRVCRQPVLLAPAIRDKILKAGRHRPKGQLSAELLGPETGWPGTLVPPLIGSVTSGPASSEKIGILNQGC